MKKFLSIFLSAMMTVSVFTASGATAAAYETDTAESQAQTEQIGSGDSVYGNFEYTVSYNNEVTITKYKGSDTEVVIPSAIDGKPVTSIGDNAFSNCSTLTSVTIPDSVAYICAFAFSFCRSLTSVTIPDSVTSIGNNAFRGCSSLTSVMIPSSVTSIGDLFDYCSSLTNIDVDTDNENYSSSDGVLFNKNKTELIRYPQGKVNTSYTIPDSVTSISNRAFDYCSSFLKSVTIPDSVIHIGSGAFYYCSSLTSVTISNSVTRIESATFRGCSSLASVVIPDGVISIGQYAFEYCSSLTSVTIPDSVTNIGDDVFDNCSSLTNIDVDNNNANYSSTDGVLFNKNKTKIIRYPAGNKNASYTTPNSVISIGYHAFAHCCNLTSVTISDSVIKIENYAFDYCSLTSVTIPNSVIFIGDAAFLGCKSLTSVTIPSSVTSIEYATFESCSSLTSVTIPESVTSIGSEAFRGCSSLTSVTIPDSVTSIGNFVFQFCRNLTSVTIPDSVTSIGNYAFSCCISLKSVTMPDSVTSIGYGAFDDCIRLKSVTILNSVASISDKAFGYDINGNKIYGFTICGYNGSSAEAYANENGFIFAALEKEVENVTLNKTTITIGVGQSYTLKAATDPEDAETTFTWKSSKKDIATVTSKGKVTGKAVGRATITVKTANGKTATCKVEVKPAPESVAISKTSIKIGVKQKYTLTATLTPSNTATYCTWSSDNTAVATVNSGGVVTGKKTGTAVITVKTSNGKTATCKVTVKKAPIAIALDKTELYLNVDETYTLTKLVPENSAAEYTWSSSDADVAEVSSAGKVTAKKTGTAIITLSSHNGKTAACTVTVN